MQGGRAADLSCEFQWQQLKPYNWWALLRRPWPQRGAWNMKGRKRGRVEECPAQTTRGPASAQAAGPLAAAVRDRAATPNTMPTRHAQPATSYQKSLDAEGFCGQRGVGGGRHSGWGPKWGPSLLGCPEAGLFPESRRQEVRGGQARRELALHASHLLAC